MNPLVIQVWDEVSSAWRFRWLALAMATVIALAGWLLVFALPDRYLATASVFVDTRTPLKPALQGLTVDQDVDAQLNFVRQSMLAGPALRRVAHEAGVFPDYAIDPRREEAMLSDLSRRISITARSASGREEERNTAGSIYRIDYLDGDRARSLRLVKILLDSFVNETLGGKREGSENAQQFLEAQIQDYEKRLRTAEDRLAQFKAQHLGLMPDDKGGYFAQLQKESEAVTSIRTKLAEAESRRAALSRQLHGDVAVAAAGSPSGSANSAAGGLDTLSRIDQAQAHLDELLLRFTDQHPDVIAARQTLADLKKRRADEIDNLRRGDAAAAATSRAASNPVYQSVQLALNQVDVDVADLNTELAQHQLKVNELRRLLDTAPQVEAEFAQLNRDYDVNKAEYTALLGNLQKARLGERADNAGSIRFEIVQPPTASFRPVWPLRPMMLAGTLLGALAVGGLLAYVLNRLHPIVASTANLARAGVPLLGVVSVAFPSRIRRARRRSAFHISIAAACLIVAFGVAVILSHQGYRLTIGLVKRLVS